MLTTTRLSNLNQREKRVLVFGTLAALLLLAILLWPGGEGDPSDVQLVPADQRGGAGSAPMAAPPTPLVTAPVPVVPVPAPTAPAAAPGGGAEGLRLFGIAGRGAIIGTADGSQRYVGLGREVLPGLRLQALRGRHVILTQGMTTYRLGFSGSAVAMGPPAAAPAVPPAPGVTARPAGEQADTARYRAALAPHQVNGRTIGYAIRPGAPVPLLERAGLRPGDIIVSVNGQSINSGEKLTELASEINAASTARFEIIRDGRRQALALPVAAAR